MMDTNLVSALVQGGSAGAVIVVVILFLNFLREERKVRMEENKERDTEFMRRNDSVCKSLDVMAINIAKLTEKMVEHDANVRPAIDSVLRSAGEKVPSKPHRRKEDPVD